MNSGSPSHSSRRSLLLWTAVVFFAVFAIYALWIWQGVDVTDEGFHLTNQWLSVAHPEAYTFGLAWLSDVLGGVWLHVTDGLGLLGARLGWALCMAFTAVSAFLCIQHFFSTRAAALAVVCTAGALGFHGVSVLDYNCIPSLFLTSGATAMLIADHRAGLGRPWRLLSVIAGILLALGAASRSPLLLALVLPFASPVFRAIHGDENSVDTWKVGLLATGSAVLVMGLLFVLLLIFGRAGEWASSLWSASAATEGSHAPANLLAFYYANGLRYFRSGSRLLVGGLLAAVAYSTLVRCSSRGRMLFVSLAVAGATGTMILFHGDGVSLRTPLIGLMWCLGGVLMILLSMGLWRSRARSTELLSVCLVGLMVPAIQMVGSNTGFFASKYGLWLLFPTAFLVLRELVEQIVGSTSRHLSRETLRALPIATMIALSLTGVYVRAHNPYRDLETPTALTVHVEHPRLRGVLTSSQRAESLSELLVQVDLHAKEGDTVLAWHSIPMIHYLTRTLPALGNPWVNVMDSQAFENGWTALWHEGGPDLVIEALVNTRVRTWAVIDEPEAADNAPVLQEALASRGYIRIWANGQFALWTPPE